MADGDNIEVYNSEGVRGSIPSANLEKARTKGYVPVSEAIIGVHPKTGERGFISSDKWEKAQAAGYTLAPELQAHEAAKKPISQLQEQAFSIFTPTGMSGSPHEKVRGAQRAVTEGALSMVGGGAAAGVKGLAGTAARMAGSGIGGGAGAAVSTADQGSKVAFWEAVKTGSIFAAFEGLGEGASAAFGRMSRLFKSDPQRMKDIGDFISTEERTRQVIQERAPQLRQSANASYPALPDVPIMPAAKTAQKAEVAAARSSVEGLPKQVGKLADIGRQRQHEALALLVKAQKVMQQQGAPEEVMQILAKAKKTGTMPAIDAQQVKSALGRLLAKGNLPGPQYQAVKASYEAIDGSIERVAIESGNIDAYRSAEARVKQWHADFDNPGAPLKKIMDAKPDERGVVLKHLIADPETRVRATEALQRNGFNVTEIQRLAEKYRNPTELNHLIEDAARAEQVGEKSFSKQEVAATREKVGKYLTRGAAGAAGVAGAYKLYQALGGKPPSLLP